MPLPAGLPEHLRPQLLLFLSADVVGSTALKQPDHGAKEPTGPAEPGSRRPLDLDWLEIYETFYRRIGESAGKHWKALTDEFKNHVDRYAGPCPVFWKTNGDEVLYYKLLTDCRQIHLVLEWWKRTIHSVRNSLDQYSEMLEGAGRVALDLKATAWTAEFPRRNKRIRSAYGLDSSVDCLVEAQVESVPARKPRKGASKAGSADAKGPYYDFIGPGLDIGFRISGHSSTQKMVISLDVAYILAVAQYRGGTSVRRQKIYFDGRMQLKGVFEGRRYPIFWLDISRPGTFDNEEVAIQQEIAPDLVADICRKYYERYRNYTHPPFIWDDPTDTISEVPDWYVAWLERANRLHQSLKATQARVSDKVENLAQTAGELETAPRRKIVTEAVSELAGMAKTISGKTNPEASAGT